MKSSSSPSSSVSVDTLQAQIDTLNRDRLKLLKKIEKQQHKIDQAQEDERAIIAKIVHNIHPISTKINEVDQEIHDLFTDIFKNRGLSHKKHQKVLNIYHNIQEVGLISNRREREVKQEEQTSESDEHTLWENLKANPDFSQIRQKFLQLAAIFHPDKVAQDQDRDYYTEVMKEVNQAYKAGDLAKLLQIEAQYYQGKIRAIGQDANLDLKEQIDRLQQENKMLNTQYQTLKQNWKSQRRTPEAQVVKTYHTLRKKRIHPIAYMKQKSKDRLVELERIRDFAKRFRDKKISTQEFLNERNPSKEIAKFVKNIFSFPSFF